MDKAEVLKRLKEHLKARKQQNGEWNRNDKYFCLRYVEDFLNMSKDNAKLFIDEHFPCIANFK